MKILCTGDWHITATPPTKRKDNYINVQGRKIEWILKLAHQYNATIIQPGDFFDTPNEPYWIIGNYLKLFRHYRVPIITLFGQHDMRYHSSDTMNTPLHILLQSEMFDQGYWDGQVAIETLNWNDDSEFKSFDQQGRAKVLALHKMIVKNKLWEAQEDYTHYTDLIKKEAWKHVDIFVCGDNHQFFCEEVLNEHSDFGKTLIVNCGSLMRSTIAQENHVPAVVIFDTDNGDHTIIPIPITPFDEVFNLDEAEKAKKLDERINAFVQKLKGHSEIGSVDFVNDLEKFIKENEIHENTQAIIWKAINGDQGRDTDGSVETEDRDRDSQAREGRITNPIKNFKSKFGR